MRPVLAMTLVLISFAACSCSERPVGDDGPEPDIEGLCRTFCERAFECGITGPVRTVEQCVAGCMGVREWDDPACVGPYEDLYVCMNQFECPEFTNLTFCDDETMPDHQCCPEIRARDRACYR
ncbi:hypothetical protein [Paraliomyxa miuraensis]|uniref:hypothetical protein n=1 Tax=Paraliomyxa miuraensis TaxID=376150 RepID=UPI00224DA91E|nr:hypothetical protein [Paraliomyxa miuraensis]MCX4245620.1 hypothetical protein [Paraliomyxa miuraensis]